nr:hypothetical protein [Sicyoidochytrium minutum DNA virus]
MKVDFKSIPFLVEAVVFKALIY